jgi:hypothetical protein
MKTTKTYLNDAHDIVSRRDATWLVETTADASGAVHRQRWFLVVRRTRKHSPKPAPARRRK